MKLSELNRYIDELKQEQLSINEKLCHITDQLAESTKHINNLILENTKLLQNFRLLDNHINSLRNTLKTYDYFYKAKEYNQSLLPKQIIDELIVRFSIYSDCNYPSLYIGNEPRLSNSLIAADPLYIASWNQNVINEIKGQYNPVYQKKLMIYNLTEDDFSDLDVLPLNQLRSIVCWDVINFLSLSNAGPLLYKFLLLLRPGGTVFFNFNNCDKQHILIKAENYEIPYQTVQDIRAFLPKFMAKEFDHTNFNEDLDYIKITKRGHLQTIKLQPVLGEIISKSS